MDAWSGFRRAPGTAVARMRGILELDVRKVLPLVTAPTLVIQNRADAYVRAGHGRYLADHIPNARLLERDSADHWPVPDPDVLAAIEEFVTGSRAQEVAADRVLMTVLFVDMVGSTERVNELGDQRWRTLLTFRSIVERELPPIAASSSNGQATGSSRPSTGQHAPSAAHTTFATRFDELGSTSAAGCTRAR